MISVARAHGPNRGHADTLPRQIANFFCSAVDIPAGVSEIPVAKRTLKSSKMVDVDRIAKARLGFSCRRMT